MVFNLATFCHSTLRHHRCQLVHAFLHPIIVILHVAHAKCDVLPQISRRGRCPRPGENAWKDQMPSTTAPNALRYSHEAVEDDRYGQCLVAIECSISCPLSCSCFLSVASVIWKVYLSYSGSRSCDSINWDRLLVPCLDCRRCIVTVMLSICRFFSDSQTAYHDN